MRDMFHVKAAVQALIGTAQVLLTTGGLNVGLVHRDTAAD